MKDFDEEPEPMEVFLSDEEAEAFCGAEWRKPETAELEELAWFIADDYIRSTARLFEEYTDETEMLIRIAENKEEILKELQNLTMVLDFKSLDTCVFYTFQLTFSKGQKTDTLWFSDGLSRYLKRGGELSALNSEDNYLFKI